MSNIVLKDKSGVKNTYSDINAINIPDGNGGFVKYSLGGTHLPEYDGTVIIEKAESVLGFRRFKEGLVTPTVFDTISADNVSDFYTNNLIKISEISVNDITFNEFTPLVNFDGTELIIVGYNGEVVEGTPFSNFNAILILNNEGVFNVISTTNSTVDEWLLANTEGVSV